MKFTFPHMGNTYISAKVLFDTIGADYVMPPLCNKKTLEYGTKHSPEFICLPFKTVLGDVMQGLDQGADVVLFGGGCGQCRFGYYGDLMKAILNSLGYQFRYLHIDFSKMTYREIIKEIRSVTKGISRIKIFRALVFTLHTVFFIDKMYERANYVRCREVEKGATDQIIKGFKAKVLKAKGYQQVKRLASETVRLLKNVEIDRKYQPIRIGIVGEIFIACEPFTNMEIEKRLGNMGVEVHNYLSIGEWIHEHFIMNLIPFRQKNKSLLAAREYLNTNDIGGHGTETIGNSILCSKKGFDGMIHVYPFTCMPEIVAQSAFGDIQRKYDIPIMSLIIDELSGEAGYITRLEAFVDMIQLKKSAKEMDLSEAVLN